MTVSDVRLKTIQSWGSNTLSTTDAEFTASAYSLNATPAPAPKAGSKEGAPNARKSS